MGNSRQSLGATLKLTYSAQGSGSPISFRLTLPSCRFRTGASKRYLHTMFSNTFRVLGKPWPNCAELEREWRYVRTSGTSWAVTLHPHTFGCNYRVLAFSDSHVLLSESRLQSGLEEHSNSELSGERADTLAPPGATFSCNSDSAICTH